MQLYVDNRERQIIPLLEAAAGTVLELVTKNLTIGDYAFVHNDEVKFIVERKTWQDLHASVLGDRYKNVEKLLHANAPVIYLIEGKLNPVRSQHVVGRRGLTYQQLYSHLDHLMLNDGVHVIMVPDQTGTVSRLLELCLNCMSASKQDRAGKRRAFTAGCNVSMVEHNAIGSSVAGNQVDGGVDHHGVDAGSIDTTGTAATEPPSSNVLFTKFQKTSIGVHHDIVRKIPAVSNTVGDLLLDKFTLRQILLNQVRPETIADLIYPGQLRRVGPNKAKKITEFIRYIHLYPRSEPVAKLLSAIPGVGIDTAAVILGKYHLLELLTASETDKITMIQAEFMLVAKPAKSTKRSKKQPGLPDEILMMMGVGTCMNTPVESSPAAVRKYVAVMKKIFTALE